MYDKCAAGTGRFLDIAARNLEVDIIELGDLHYESKDSPLPVNSTCAVFAESEIISLLAAGHKTSEIVSGIHYSVHEELPVWQIVYALKTEYYSTEVLH